MIPRKRITVTFIGLSFIFTLLWAGIATAQESQNQSTFQTPIVVVNTSFLNVRVGPGVQYATLVTVVGGTELPVLGAAGDNVWYQVATDAGVGWLNVTFTLPRGDFRNVPRVRHTDAVTAAGQGGGVAPAVSASTGMMEIPKQGVAILGSDLRAAPSNSAQAIRRPLPNDPNTIYPIQAAETNAEDTWYMVNVPGVGMGWVNKVELRLLQCDNINVVTLTREEPIRFEGISNRESYLLMPGTEAYLLDQRDGFGTIELVDGQLGRVNMDAVAPRSSDVVSLCSDLPMVTHTTTTTTSTALGQGGGIAPSPAQAISGNRVIINTGNLNIRSGPAVGFASLAVVPGGTELAVIGRARDNVWLLVQGGFGQGWINSEFAIFRGDFGSVPVIRDTSEYIFPAASMPSTSLGQGGGVVAPMAPTGTGMMEVPKQGVAILGSDLRAGPSNSAQGIRRPLPNDPNTIYPIQAAETNAEDTWYMVNVPGVGMGWVNKVELRLLQCGNINVVALTREEPIRFEGISNRESYLLMPGTEAYLLDQRDGFGTIELVDGQLGRVNMDAIAPRSSDVVSLCDDVPMVTHSMTSPAVSSPEVSSPSVAPSAVSGNRVIINTGNLNVRSGPSAGFSVVVVLPGGSEVAVTGRTPDGVWYRVTGNFGEGWVNSEFTIFRGSYSTIPVIGY